MKKEKLGVGIRIILIICGLALIPVLFVPMWKIDLVAPQYPEGLMLLIYPDKLGGNVDIINGLNHYIGMKTLHTADFIEFTVLPYIISFFALLFLLTGFVAKRKWLYLLTLLFVSFGVLAMVDFWRWEYNYGHNLNPDAAIIVPGMAYQPPLIGFKQLLNFGAYSMPNIGGWIFISVGVLLMLCTIIVWNGYRKKSNKFKPVTALILFSMVCMLSCNKGPQQILTGTDHCYSCKMTISDPRFGAEIITQKGKAYKFDDTHCLLGYLRSNDLPGTEIKDIYVSNFSMDHQLLNIKEALLLSSEEIRGPMGGNIAAFNHADSFNKIREFYKGIAVNWGDVKK